MATPPRLVSRAIAALFAGGLVAGVMVFAPAAPAVAHDTLLEAVPGDGQTVDAVDSIELSYSGTLLSIGEDQRSAAIQVTRDDRYFEQGCPRLVDNTASVDVALGEAGEYDVTWQVVSSDGHTISGQYSFDYQPADGRSGDEGAPSPACGDGAAGSDAGPSDDAVLIGAAVAIAGVAAVGVLVAFILGRRRSGERETGHNA